MGIKREKVLYHDEIIVDDFASATAIRRMIATRQFDDIIKVIPRTSYVLLAQEVRKGHYVLDLSKFQKEIIYILRKMTVEEIEIIVTAKVEEALKEFEKMLPAIKKAMKEAQDAFSKVDTKAMTSKLHQAVNFMKKKMQDLKKSSENNEIAIKVNNKDAQKQITQIEKEIDSLQKKITGRQLKLDVTNNALDKIRNETNQSVIKEMPEAGNRQIKEATYKKLDNNVNYQSLVKQSDKLNSEIEKYNALLNSAKSKMVELGQQTSKTSTIQNKLSSFFGAFKQKIEQVKPSISNINNVFKTLPKLTQNITNNIKWMSTGVKNGLGHVLKYAGALFSMQSVYSALSGAAHTWLSSQNAGAKQLSANIEYLKYSVRKRISTSNTICN